jgi:hypothetical protein
MATLLDVEQIANGLPEVTEGARHGNKTWFVGKKAFVWERPLTKADIKRYGDETPPDGEIIALSTADLHEKEAILAAGQPGFFTMTHFDGYPAYLIQLKAVRKRALREAIADAYDAALTKKKR